MDDDTPPNTVLPLADDSSRAGAAVSHQGTPPPGLLQRLTRSLRRGTSMSMNPAAANARMPPKRKASTSRPGKSVHSSASRSQNTYSTSTDIPIIRSEDLFGKDNLIRLSDSLDGSSDDDAVLSAFERDVQQFAQPPNGHDEGSREAIALLRSRIKDTKVKTTPGNIQCSSAILFTQGNLGGGSEAICDLHRLRYLPLRPVTTSGSRDFVSNDTNLTILPTHRQRIDRAGDEQTPSRAHWRESMLPVELFELITTYLSRDDIKSMRLVTKEFEAKVSATLFNTSVVPFNTELYDMIDEDRKAARRGSRHSLCYQDNGKGAARDVSAHAKDLLPGGLHWQNAREDVEGKVYKGHGLRVFQGFGRHIKRFGMSFEVAESQLAHPPIKRELDHIQAYHGSYEWPPYQYLRFDNLAGLERTADDTQRMRSAFSNLESVREVALSIDSGLGWLSGPDKSLKAQVFQRPSAVFGQSRPVEDNRMQDAKLFWSAIQSCHQSLGVSNKAKEMSLAKKVLSDSLDDLPGLQYTHYANCKLWSSIAACNVTPAASYHIPEGPSHGILYTTSAQPDPALQPLFDRSALVPSDLRKEQKEWLMETEWAQRAFLECYMLAIMDNPTQFHNVKTLKIARISSGYIPLLARETFWDALPNLTDVTIHVKPDWRTVEKDNVGFAEVRALNSSEAIRQFHGSLLNGRIRSRPSVKKLNIGWASGGEQADGIFARNANILPAPITQLEHSTSHRPSGNVDFGLIFDHVEQLTLYNCWITPPTLTELVKNHSDKALKSLTLDSVSLTAHPRFPAGGQAGAPLPPHIAHMIAMGGNGIVNPHQLLQAQQAQHAQAQAQAQGHGQAPNPNQMMANLLGAQPNNQQPPQVQGANLHAHLQQQFLQLAQQHGGAFGINHLAAPFQGGAAQHLAHNNVFGNPVPAPSHWSADHREGSWPDVLDNISPGLVFTDYLPPPAEWEQPRPERSKTALQSIELKSCGYAKLNDSTAFDQFALVANHDHHLSNWFRTRQMALAQAMMSASSDRYLARIVQYMPQRELDALLLGWGLTHGWEDVEKAEEAEYDGYLPGGTGRVSGRVWRGMALVGQTSRP
ncbi:hypothetical protein DOTSEDRAFT_69541 [Dothistroma septosporum NZE10]|uniref:F-box domain-containing protein n=1 Tax=Dothistroma septosporum (strain NZE10 / CBS 128990) TaxID=675120 RepID=N1PXC7_DOTSN|nr:hypothetical protein DOTSEDRAFT_69541 [Dothistroma septosporum NZE10]